MGFPGEFFKRIPFYVIKFMARTKREKNTIDMILQNI